MKTEPYGFRLSFYLKKNEASAGGESPVMGRISSGGTTAVFSLRCTFNARLWDTTSGKALGRSHPSQRMNTLLDQARQGLCTHYARLRQQRGDDSPIPARELKEAYQGISCPEDSLPGFFEAHNRTFLRRAGIDREASPARQYANSLRHLRSFLSRRYHLSDIPFSALDRPFIENFDFYLRVVLQLKSGTILGITGHLRRMVRLAVRRGLLAGYPFTGYSPEKSPPG